MVNICAGDLLSEVVFLTVASVPDIVCYNQCDEQSHVVCGGPLVFSRIMLSKEDSAMAVSKWYTSHIPKDEHEAPLLMKHVPSCR